MKVFHPRATNEGRGVWVPAFAGTTRWEASRLLIPRIEFFARGGRRGHVVGTRAVRTAPPARETFAVASAFISARSAVHLRLRSGDEGRQAIDAAGIGNHRLRLVLRLRTVLALDALNSL